MQSDRLSIFPPHPSLRIRSQSQGGGDEGRKGRESRRLVPPSLLYKTGLTELLLVQCLAGLSPGRRRKRRKGREGTTPPGCRRNLRALFGVRTSPPMTLYVGWFFILNSYLVRQGSHIHCHGLMALKKRVGETKESEGVSNIPPSLPTI